MHSIAGTPQKRRLHHRGRRHDRLRGRIPRDPGPSAALLPGPDFSGQGGGPTPGEKRRAAAWRLPCPDACAGIKRTRGGAAMIRRVRLAVLFLSPLWLLGLALLAGF